MGKHASTVSHLDMIIWGIDYPSFSETIGNTEFDRELKPVQKIISFIVLFLISNVPSQWT